VNGVAKQGGLVGDVVLGDGWFARFRFALDQEEASTIGKNRKIGLTFSAMGAFGHAAVEGDPTVVP